MIAIADFHNVPACRIAFLARHDLAVSQQLRQFLR